LEEPGKLRNFEQTVLPHLDSAYNLARRLIRNDPNAEDLVQEACLRALKSFGETSFAVVPWGAELSLIEEALRALLGIAEPTDELVFDAPKLDKTGFRIELRVLGVTR